MNKGQLSSKKEECDLTGDDTPETSSIQNASVETQREELLNLTLWDQGRGQREIFLQEEIF